MQLVMVAVIMSRRKFLNNLSVDIYLLTGMHAMPCHVYRYRYIAICQYIYVDRMKNESKRKRREGLILIC
jgi:hypothetical protein